MLASKKTGARVNVLIFILKWANLGRVKKDKKEVVHEER